jgi:hypothetical protein
MSFIYIPSAGGGVPDPHAPSHSDGGSDEITVEDLATSGGLGTVPTSDGLGGLVMAAPTTLSVGGEPFTITHGSDLDLAAFASLTLIYTVPASKLLKVTRVWVRHKTHTNDGVNAFIRWEAPLATPLVAAYQISGTAVNDLDETITPPAQVFVATDSVYFAVQTPGTHTSNTAAVGFEGVLYDV